jgi:UDP-N-acetylmuramate--alanine ligase
MKEKYHFIGIGGIGMSALARILLQKGYSVSGSDIAITPLIESMIKQGAIVHKGQSEDNISSDLIVVYSSDIKGNNPEYRAAIEKKCTMLHRADLLAKLVSEQQSLAVAGTHGKTTTSALLAAVLVESGGDPSFAIGGVLPQFQTNSRYGTGRYFAFEADESDQSFLKYHPFGAIVTNIDHDHLSNYEGDPHNLIQAFQRFMHQVQNEDHLFWCSEDLHLRELNLAGQSYGRGEECRWRALNIRQEGFKSFFDIRNGQHLFENIELSLIGLHNALNATGVFAMALTLGIAEEKIRHAFKAFQGVQRRCEKRGNFNRMLFLDDYAHHPTEIQTTLEGIRRAIGEKRLVVAFQPHRYSRTLECQGLFGPGFVNADAVFITDVFAAGEEPILSISGENVMKEVKDSLKAPCHYVPRTALSHQLSRFLQPDDVVVTLGAGDITKVSSEILILLENLQG